MYLEIISPEQTLFKGDVESILFPGSHGDFQVLNDHAPIVSNLTKGKVKIIGDKSLSKRDFLRVTEPLKKFGSKIDILNT